MHPSDPEEPTGRKRVASEDLQQLLSNLKRKERRSVFYRSHERGGCRRFLRFLRYLQPRQRKPELVRATRQNFMPPCDERASLGCIEAPESQIGTVYPGEDEMRAMGI